MLIEEKPYHHQQNPMIITRKIDFSGDRNWLMKTIFFLLKCAGNYNLRVARFKHTSQRARQPVAWKTCKNNSEKQRKSTDNDPEAIGKNLQAEKISIEISFFFGQHGNIFFVVWLQQFSSPTTIETLHAVNKFAVVVGRLASFEVFREKQFRKTCAGNCDISREVHVGR